MAALTLQRKITEVGSAMVDVDDHLEQYMTG